MGEKTEGAAGARSNTVSQCVPFAVSDASAYQVQICGWREQERARELSSEFEVSLTPPHLARPSGRERGLKREAIETNTMPLNSSGFS